MSVTDKKNKGANELLKGASCLWKELKVGSHELFFLGISERNGEQSQNPDACLEAVEYISAASGRLPLRCEALSLTMAQYFSGMRVGK